MASSGTTRPPFPAPTGPAASSSVSGPGSGRDSRPGAHGRLDSLAFHRRDDGRVIAGVAGGFADDHGVDPTLLRAALVVLSLAGGLGLLLYAVGALVAREPSGAPSRRATDRRRTLSVACISAGLLLVMRSTGLWLGDPVMVPIVTVAAGLVVIGFVRPDVGERPWQALSGPGETSGRRARGRLLAGAVLVAFGLLLVAARENASSSVRIGAFATAITVLGVAVLVGPWLARLAQEAAAERRERIRVQEREAMAAHLHDSVLQTLALIQRTADDPRRTVTLARQQERELRDWLYGPGAAARADAAGMPIDTLASALRRTVAEVESAYDVRVELVMVGDAPCDDVIDALVAATREACVNAAKHSGAEEVSLYAEVRGVIAEVFVRDRGAGFERAAIAADRRGIEQSIEARLDRVGGRARVETSPGEGTEWQLSVPVSGASSGPEVV